MSVVRIFFLFCCICFSFSSQGAFYSNSILEEASASKLGKKFEKSIATPVYGLKRIGDEYHVNYSSVEEIKGNVCSDQRYLDQPALSLGTSFLIDKNKLLLAGHTAADPSFCRNFSFVFDYNLKNLKFVQNGIRFSKDEVFGCKEVYINKQKDFAIVTLDRNVKDRKIIKISESFTAKSDNRFFMLGFPLGLPLKIAHGGSLNRKVNEMLDLDITSFSGNSGSPVFDEKNETLVGLLTAGQKDFVKNENGCFEYNHCEPNNEDCKDFNILGERVVSLSKAMVKPWLSEKKAVVENLVQRYNPKVKEKFGMNISLIYNKANILQATAGVLASGIPELTVYRGILDSFKKFEIATVVCHEIGHILGEIDHLSIGSPRELGRGNALEGEADYFAGSCLYEFLQSQNITFKSKDIEECNQVTSMFGRKKDCSMSINLAKATLWKIYNESFDYRIALDEVYDGVHNSYPSKECRILTIINGVLNLERPKCWYNPSGLDQIKLTND